jgi:hypothetical protein
MRWRKIAAVYNGKAKLLSPVNILINLIGISRSAFNAQRDTHAAANT